VVAITIRILQKSIDETRLPAILWFAKLALDFGITDPQQTGQDILKVIEKLPKQTDAHSTVEMYRLAARAFQAAKMSKKRDECLVAISDRWEIEAESKSTSPLLAAHFISLAIGDLRGLPNVKETRNRLRKKLIDVQKTVPDEMHSFEHEIDLTDLAEATRHQFSSLGLIDCLFAFAELGKSPEIEKLRTEAIASIQKYPMSSMFGTVFTDRDGKTVYKSDGIGGINSVSESLIFEKICQNEQFRRQIFVRGSVEAARQIILENFYVSTHEIERVVSQSPFICPDQTRTYSIGFTRFFQGDYTAAIYILTPLLENSLRYVLANHGHDVTVFDDQKRTQKDRTITQLFEQMGIELKNILGEPIFHDLELLFLKEPGPRIRHELAHGLFHDGEPYSPESIYACWLLFRICLLPLFPYRSKWFGAYS
jgi:hypothetical protein